MNRKNEILQDAFVRNDINGIDTPNHIVWKVIKEAMKDYKDQDRSPIEGLTIGDITNDNKQCNHKWQECGYSFYKCGNEGCSAWYTK